MQHELVSPEQEREAAPDWYDVVARAASGEELAELWEPLAKAYVADEVRYWTYNNDAWRIKQRAAQLAAGAGAETLGTFAGPLRAEGVPRSATVERAEERLEQKKPRHPSWGYNPFDVAGELMEEPDACWLKEPPQTGLRGAGCSDPHTHGQVIDLRVEHKERDDFVAALAQLRKELAVQLASATNHYETEKADRGLTVVEAALRAEGADPGPQPMPGFSSRDTAGLPSLRVLRPDVARKEE